LSDCVGSSGCADCEAETKIAGYTEVADSTDSNNCVALAEKEDESEYPDDAGFEVYVDVTHCEGISG